MRGTIIEAEIKTAIDPGRPLPLICALYAVESPEGVWLCAYYGTNRSVFDFLPQKGMEVNEETLGIFFYTKELVSKDKYRPECWEEFKRLKFMAYGAQGE